MKQIALAGALLGVLSGPVAAGHKEPTTYVGSATSGAIGGVALLAGSCTTGTVAIVGATTSMAVVVSPTSNPGNPVEWKGYVSTAGTVTIVVCALTALTPTSTTYNVRVLP